jgi:hypothetical protein
MMILTDARKAVEEEGLPWSMWDDFTGTCFPDAKVAGGLGDLFQQQRFQLEDASPQKILLKLIHTALRPFGK